MKSFMYWYVSLSPHRTEFQLVNEIHVIEFSCTVVLRKIASRKVSTFSSPILHIGIASVWKDSIKYNDIVAMWRGESISWLPHHLPVYVYCLLSEQILGYIQCDIWRHFSKQTFTGTCSINCLAYMVLLCIYNHCVFV